MFFNMHSYLCCQLDDPEEVLAEAWDASFSVQPSCCLSALAPLCFEWKVISNMQ